MEEKLKKLGFIESLTKPSLWYMQKQGLIIYLDLRGIIPRLYSFQDGHKITIEATRIAPELQGVLDGAMELRKKRVYSNNARAMREWVALLRAFYRLPKAEQEKRLQQGRCRHEDYISQTRGDNLL